MTSRAAIVTQWHADEGQLSWIRSTFTLTIHDEPIHISRDDIDRQQSLSVGQNRPEMALDPETVEIVAAYMDDGDSFAMPLVWKPTGRKGGKVVVLDGNHRLESAFEHRGDASVPCILVTGDQKVAQTLALVVNMRHGRSTRDPAFTAATMRLLRDQGQPLSSIAMIFGVSEQRVQALTRREAQQERIRKLIPERRTKVLAHTLDLLGNVEDKHVAILGELFLDATKTAQDDYVAQLKATPSADRDAVAHQIVGELTEADRARRKVKARTSRPSSSLKDGLQRLVKVTDVQGAYFGAPDGDRAVMRSNLSAVLPRLTRLSTTIAERTGEGPA